MSFLSGLFGGGSTTGKIIDGVVNGVDAAFYTDEERAIAAQKVLDFKLEWLKATQGQNIARRIIAFMVAGLWCLFALTAFVSKLLGNVEMYDDILKMMNDVINAPFMLVMGFYFAAHMLKGLRK